MQSAAIIRLIDANMATHRWMEQRLPLHGSMLAYHMLLLAAKGTLLNAPINNKQLVSTLNCSAMGVRKQLNRLVKAGWMRMDTDVRDKRVKLIMAQPKLLAVMNEYSALRKVSESPGDHFGEKTDLQHSSQYDSSCWNTTTLVVMSFQSLSESREDEDAAEDFEPTESCAEDEALIGQGR